jgi:hypothetical protein
MTPAFACHLGKAAPLDRGEVAIAGALPAIRIHAAPLAAPAGLWGLALSVGYLLPMSFVAAVASLSRAFVLTLEDHDGRARAALRLGAFGAEAPAPNFTGRPLARTCDSSTMEGQFASAVWVVRVPELAGRPLVARVVLQALVSNPLTLVAPGGDD